MTVSFGMVVFLLGITLRIKLSIKLYLEIW